MYDLCSFSAHSIAPVHSQRMEIELGLTISHAVDDFTPSADHLYHVVCRETDSMFILTAQIKGYEGEHVEIVINEDGTRMAIRAQKPFLENWTVGWKMHTVKRKVFKIPDAVILDKIKAMFNEEVSVLTILMPKAMKGICGIGVEEVKEDQGIGTVGSTRVVHDQVSEEKGNESPPPLVQKDQVVEGSTDDEILRVQRKTEGEESEREECPRGITATKEDKSCHEINKIDTSGPKQVTDVVKEVEGEKEMKKRGNEEKEQEQKDDVEEQNGLEKIREEVCHDDPPEREKEKSLGDEATQGNQPPEKRSMICAPVIAGSAFLVSIIVLVIHLKRKKNPPRKSEN
ncbi:uncharacterized protein LOC131306470 isoform X2 [Rhododendron vialii]|uniref:uncharacterized protein LOC131306470 isoform X2 n=2 Tax=Rhododendron vialii TaxID=182163 RepID=UPI00265F8183|nr:uncharacterized protein LOC131306470 isoform X2 [Rhododendron vialii]